jgi:hypothetical protein
MKMALDPCSSGAQREWMDDPRILISGMADDAVARLQPLHCVRQMIRRGPGEFSQYGRPGRATVVDQAANDVIVNFRVQ